MYSLSLSAEQQRWEVDMPTDATHAHGSHHADLVRRSTTLLGHGADWLAQQVHAIRSLERISFIVSVALEFSFNRFHEFRRQVVVGMRDVEDARFELPKYLSLRVPRNGVSRSCADAGCHIEFTRPIEARKKRASFSCALRAMYRQRFHAYARDDAWRRLAAVPMEGLAYRLNASIYVLGEPMDWSE